MPDPEEQINAACQKMGEKFLELYGECCKSYNKILVVTAMTGALAACVKEMGYSRNNLIDAVNSAFDDIEAGESEPQIH